MRGGPLAAFPGPVVPAPLSSSPGDRPHSPRTLSPQRPRLTLAMVGLAGPVGSLLGDRWRTAVDHFPLHPPPARRTSS
jgi:hypothetical protein